VRFADLVVRGSVFTGDPAAPWTDAVAVRGDRIIGLGAEYCEQHRGAQTRVIETSGSVVPGFQDAHVHPAFAARNQLNIDLSALAGRTAYLDHIAAFAAAHPYREWLIGGGWAMEHFPGGTPDKTDLDAICPDRPVFLFNRDVHGAWLNSVALARAGIDARTADPPDGRIERDPASGEPTGTLHEGAAYAVEARVLPRPDRAEWERAIRRGQAHLHALGITGWQDAWVTPDTQAAYLALATDGRLTARVVGALWWERDRGLEQIDDLRGRREQAADSFRPDTVKIMIDGVLENQTGALIEPYCDGCGGHTDHRGLTYVDPDLLAAAVTQLDGLGFSVHMHAIGDRAVRMGLDAVAAARSTNPGSAGRHHIAHLQVVQPEDVPRFAALDVTANCQAYWAQSEPQMDELTIPFIGRDRADLQYPFGDLVRAGARLAMGSDWGVTTANPLDQLQVMVTRIDPEQRANAPFLPEQALPLATGLTAFTAGSAYVNHDERGGSARVGARADLAVLDADLFEPGLLPTDARVTHTVAGGVVVHESGSG
jgi:predicted amidohydrolase YtcJ